MTTVAKRILIVGAVLLLLYSLIGLLGAALSDITTKGEEGGIVRDAGAAACPNEATVESVEGETDSASVSVEGECAVLSVSTEAGSAPLLPGLLPTTVYTDYCSWAASIRILDVNVYSMTVTQIYGVGGFSEITEWENPDVDAALTVSGALVYDELGTSSDSYALTYFSPGVVAELYVWARGGIEYPRIPPTLWKGKLSLAANVRSPGFDPDGSGTRCPSQWTYKKESVTDPITGGAEEFLDWITDGWWCC